MDIQGFFTKKGLLLAAKLAAGSTLKITWVCAGAAETALTASALSQIRQTVSVGAARRNGDTAVLPVTLEAGMAGSAYALRELGIYAKDPDEGEILYKVYRLSEPVEIRPSSRLVLRFYLEETVSQDLNVTVVRASAGLLTEADLEPLRRRVEARSVPVRTEEMAAPELNAYILSLPRLLTENLTVRSSGTAGNLDVERFYGPGSLTVTAKEGETLTIGSVYASGDRAPICFRGVQLQGAAPFANTYLTVNGCRGFTLESCGVTGTGKQFDGLNVRDASTFSSRQCAFTGLNRVVISSGSSVAVFADCEGSGNSCGVFGAGGVVLLAGTTPPLLGGVSNGRHSGGLIVKADGTLI